MRGDDHIFLLGLHRGGTTYAQRCLNCQPEVTIWGENGGLISKLREVEVDFHNSPTRKQRPPPQNAFEPWANPHDELTPLFRAGLEDWMARGSITGFKEIRHNNREDILYLHSLFPDARIVGVLREAPGLAMSRYACAWTDTPTSMEKMREHAHGVITQVERVRKLYEEFSTKATWFEWVRLEDITEDPSPLFEAAGLDQRGLQAARQLPKVGSSHGDVGADVSSTQKELYEDAFVEVASEHRTKGCTYCQEDSS